MITRSGKELKFVENKTVEDYFETTRLKLFPNFTGSLSGKTFVINTSRQNLPRWFDNDNFHCYHSGEVVETCFLPSLLYIVFSFRPLCPKAVVTDFVLVCT